MADGNLKARVEGTLRKLSFIPDDQTLATATAAARWRSSAPGPAGGLTPKCRG